MIIKKNGKKSSGKWVSQLFQQSGTALGAYQGKTYYAQRSHDERSITNPTAFNGLFSGSGNPGQVAENAGLQRPYGHNRALANAKPSIVKHALSCGTDRFATSDDGFTPIGHGNIPTQLTVLNCYHETPDTKTFRLGCLDRQKFDYLAGQYLTLSASVAGKAYKRSYSLASSPSRLGIIEITVKRDPNGGVVSNWLNDHLKVGDTLNVKGPFGNFSCGPNPPQKIMFLAAGSGIVPIMSMLRWLTDTEARVDISVLFSFRTRADIIYREELNLIATRHHNIKLFITLTKEPSGSTQWLDLTGRIDQKQIADLVPDLPERMVYLCGPDTFMADCRIHLHSLQLPAGHLFCESFNVDSTAQARQETIACAQSNTQHPTVQPLPRKTGAYQVRFAKSAITITTDGSRTILDIAETAGIILDHECRAGTCGECMIKCLEGGIVMKGKAEIDDSDKKKGWIYACCAYPTSNVALDI